MIQEVFASLFMAIGALFIFAAAVGLLRFKDPLQRMHASTKAGTVGAGLTVIGLLIEQADGYFILVGLATVGFLLMTIPVAGHVLGRAAYTSGARLSGSNDNSDALNGELQRSKRPLEELLRY